MADDFDIVVAGGGIAGLTAGLTAARLGRSALILTGGVPGGLLLSIDHIEGVPGFPDGVAGYELCPIAQEQADAAGAQFSMEQLEGLERVDGGWTVATGEGEKSARAVILATGTSFRRLGVPGEDRLQGHGISTCASCDAPLLRGKVAAVVGGGDSALQEALTLAESLERVIVLHRGEGLDAQASYRERVLASPAIEIRYRIVVEEILGDPSLGSVRIRDLASDAVEELEVAGLFPFVGLRPNTEQLDGIEQVDGGWTVATGEGDKSARAVILATGASFRQLGVPGEDRL
ncbi:MAG: FAD-dependent oxidoreductase, partial [Gaiellaceae bacterium]